MLTPEQLAERSKYIGSSDAAGVMGLSRWDTVLSLWAKKTGRVEPEDISQELPVKLGNMLEDTVAALFMEEAGKKVHRVNQTIIHPKYAFICANIDRRVVGEDAILECKTASAWKAKEWKGEEIPQEYIIQCYHQLAVTGAKVCYIAVLIGNQEFQWKAIYRDEDIIKNIISKEFEFWTTYVTPNVMPMHITKDDGNMLYQLFPISDPNQDIALPDQANMLIESIEANTTEMDLLEADIEKAKNELKAMLGEAESGRTGIRRITWKKQTSKRIDTERLKKEQETIYSAYLKESSTRVFRHSIIKEK
jgi:putative phage-type endonuclease